MLLTNPSLHLTVAPARAYIDPAAAKSVAGIDSPKDHEAQTRRQHPLGAFFYARKIIYGGPFRETFGSAGVLVGRSVNPLWPVTLLTGGDGSKTNRKESIMTPITQGTTAPAVFQFQQSYPVRVIVLEGEPWFCLRDVCDVLEIKQPTKVVSTQLNEDGVNKIHVTDSLGRNQETWFISEPNLYRVIFRSNKKEARQFQDWVFEEVLPAIRKTGRYDAHDFEPEPRLSSAQRLELDQAIKHALTGLWDECSDETGRQWACNRLRVMLHLRRIEDMHPDQLPLAFAELERLKEDLSAFFEYRAKERRFLCREIIGAGTPWTPHLTKQLMAELKQTVPPRPDWLEMRKKLLNQD
ncbi:BRO domain protein [Nitrosococcus halophilus Nc 4]|uniref:BRO domain protein n=2 Tax=Nitrosococcus halophilus TaxID=133539 RepID=D5BYU2_NITHN|nr:BRO domain protein [Nitrosococcus halophilus Nc 4]